MPSKLLKEVVEGTPDDASWVLKLYLNKHFHDEQYGPDTPGSVAPLVKLLRSRSPIRAEVMQRIGSLIPNERLHSVTPDSTSWTHIQNRYTPKTVKAVKTARVELERMLNDDDFDLRCATAWTLSMLGAKSKPALRARLAIEKDERVVPSLVLALGGGPGDSDVELALRASSPLDEATAAALGRLLKSERTPWLRFEKGQLSTFALRKLGTLGRDEPRTFDLLMAARKVAAARVKAGPLPRWWFEERLVSETVEAFAAGGEAAWASDGLSDINVLLAWLVFGERRSGPPLRRSELDARQAEVLPLVLSVLQHPPRSTAEGIAKFLKGDHVLDQVLRVDGKRAPVCEHIWDIADSGEPWDFDERKLKALCRVILKTPRCFELAVALLNNELPYLHEYSRPLLCKLLLPAATRRRVLAFTRRLKRPLTRHQVYLGFFLLNEWLVSGKPCPPELDVLMPSLLYEMQVPRRPFDQPHLFRWLAEFPPKRFAAFAVNSEAFDELEDLFERASLERAVLENFTAPDCSWTTRMAEERLAHVDSAKLRAMTFTGGTRAELVAEALKNN